MMLLNDAINVAKHGDGAFETHDKVVRKANDLQNKYPDYRDYRMYHVLAGSNDPDGEKSVPKSDFPGQDSVADFIRSL